MKKLLLFIFIAALNCLQAIAQPVVIPTDKQVKIGKLQNGLTYYIRKNSKPESRVELRLVVNAGSVLEKDDQQGVAHFLEHMAFNGTKNFPKNELLNYLQKAGVRFGADLNATTSFDYTVYMLPISTTDAGVLHNGYQVLRDWAGNLLLEDGEIDKERGVILEEKRMRQNAYMRAIAQYYPDKFNNSMYSLRLPIGKEDIIKQAPRKTFVDFYRDWYRPDNMAVIAVGDIDVVQTEATIKSLFGDLQNPAAAPVRPQIIPITWHKTDKVKLVSDPENTNSILTMTFGMDKKEPETIWDDYAEDKLYEVIGSLFDGRLEEYSTKSDAPIGAGNISLASGFFRGYKAVEVSAIIKDDPVAAMNLMMAEVLRAKKFGFLQPELDRVKKDILKQYEKYLAEKDKTESASYVYEYIQHFLVKEPMPGIDEEYNFIKKFLNNLSLERVNKTIAAFNLNKPAFILLNTTEAQKNIVSSTDLLAAFGKAKLQKVDPYVEKQFSGELMDVKPVAGKIIRTDIDKELDSKMLTLSNGIKVIYKKTDFKNDEIVFKATQWGGLTNLTPAEIAATKYFMLTGSMGLGQHKAADMPKVLNGVQAYMNLFVVPNQLVMMGSTTVPDFEKFLQIINLRLTNINFNAAEFEGFKASFSSQLGNLAKNPVYKFNDTLNCYKFKYSNRLSGLPLADELKALKLEDLKAAYQKICSNLNGAVFVFSGNIDENSFASMIEKYIGSIPTGAQPLSLDKENVLKPIEGKNTFVFKAGKENKSQISYSYYADLKEAPDKDVLLFGLLTDILQIKANEKLREEMGSTYAPSVISVFNRLPVAGFILNLTVSSLPENADKIIQAYDDLIKSIINGNVSEEEMVKARTQRVKLFETQSKTNMHWTNVLEQQYSYGFDSRVISEQISRINQVSKEDIISVAKKYLPAANTLKGIMNPE